MIQTNSLAEAKYLLSHAMKTRGLSPKIEGRTFSVHMTVGKFAMSFMPGNRRVMIFHNVIVEPEFRDKGYGRKWLKLREEMAIEAGINLLLATVKEENVVERHILETSGWYLFTKRQETQVGLWGKHL